VPRFLQTPEAPQCEILADPGVVHVLQVIRKLVRIIQVGREVAREIEVVLLGNSFDIKRRWAASSALQGFFIYLLEQASEV